MQRSSLKMAPWSSLPVTRGSVIDVMSCAMGCMFPCPCKIQIWNHPRYWPVVVSHIRTRTGEGAFRAARKNRSYRDRRYKASSKCSHSSWIPTAFPSPSPSVKRRFVRETSSPVFFPQGRSQRFSSMNVPPSPPSDTSPPRGAAPRFVASLLGGSWKP